MAQSGYTPILLFKSGTTGNTPTTGNLALGELAINYADGKLFYNTGSAIAVLAGAGGAGVVAGSNTQIQYNNNGSFGASANHTFDGTTLTLGNAGVSARFQGDFSNATIASRTAFVTGTANSTTGIYALPNGTATAASWQATNASDPTNASKVLIATNGSTDVQLVSGINGTGTYLPLAFYNGGVGRFVVGTSGQFGIGPTASVSYGTTGYVLTSGGASAAPTWSQVSLTAGVTGTLPVANGGTGQISYTDGQLLIGNSSGNTLTKSTLTAGSGVTITNGNGSISISATGTGGTVTSVAQSFTGGLISVSGSPITTSGTLALTVAGTSGGIPYFSSGTTWASSAALAANAIVLGGGAGAAPATTTTGTGVVTAIGNAVNTTGGLVTQSGTLAASAILIGGGSATAITSTTTGTGVVTALGNNTNATGGITTPDGTATLTNKRVNPRVSSTTSSATAVTPDISSYDEYAWTAQAATLTINAPTGTPVDGNKLIFRILDNGTPQTLSWNATFTVIGVTLPTTTTASKTTYVGCIYNANNTRWDVVAVTTQV